jgi:hypothetical protein
VERIGHHDAMARASSFRIMQTAIKELIGCGLWVDEGDYYLLTDLDRSRVVAKTDAERARSYRARKTSRNRDDGVTDRDGGVTDAERIARFCSELLNRPVSVAQAEYLASFDFPMELKLHTIRQVAHLARKHGSEIVSLKYFRSAFQEGESIWHKQGGGKRTDGFTKL